MGGAFALGVFGGIIMLVGLLLIPGTLITRNRKTREYENGLTSDWLKDEHRTIRWEEIDQVTQRREAADGLFGLIVRVNNYTLTLKNGQSVVLRSAHVKDIDTLGERIEQHIE